MRAKDLLRILQGKRLATSLRNGRYRSIFKGRGLELEELREFQEGDEVRYVDGNAFARFSVPFVKLFREEREQPCIFAFDISPSMDFGTAKSKRAVLSELASLLGEATVYNRDRLGLVLFSDRVESYLPPRSGRRHFEIAKKRMENTRPTGSLTSISEALKFIYRVEKKKVLVVLFSDCQKLPERKEIKSFQGRHELLIISTEDPAESSLIFEDWTQIEDLETGETYLIPGCALQKEFDAMSQEKQDETRNFFLSTGCDRLDYREGASEYQSLNRFLQKKT